MKLGSDVLGRREVVSKKRERIKLEPLINISHTEHGGSITKISRLPVELIRDAREIEKVLAKAGEVPTKFEKRFERRIKRLQERYNLPEDILESGFHVEGNSITFDTGD